MVVLKTAVSIGVVATILKEFVNARLKPQTLNLSRIRKTRYNRGSVLVLMVLCVPETSSQQLLFEECERPGQTLEI